MILRACVNAVVYAVAIAGENICAKAVGNAFVNALVKAVANTGANTFIKTFTYTLNNTCINTFLNAIVNIAEQQKSTRICECFYYVFARETLTV